MRIQGTEAASPVAPAYEDDHQPLCQFQLETSTTTITNSIIVDERAGVSAPPFKEDTSQLVLWDNSFSSSEGQTYTDRYLSYTKVGKRVFITGKLSMSSLGTLTTSDPAYIGGLPYPASSTADSEGGVSVVDAGALSITAGTNITASTLPGYSILFLKVWDVSAGTSNMTIAELSLGTIIFMGHYITD